MYAYNSVSQFSRNARGSRTAGLGKLGAAFGRKHVGMQSSIYQGVVAGILGGELLNEACFEVVDRKS